MNGKVVLTVVSLVLVGGAVALKMAKDNGFFDRNRGNGIPGPQDETKNNNNQSNGPGYVAPNPGSDVPQKRKFRLGLVGSSTMVALLNENKISNKFPDIDVFQYAKNGATSSILKELEGKQFDLLIINIGINDMYNGKTIDYQKLTKHINARRVVLTTLQPSKGYAKWTPSIGNKIGLVNDSIRASGYDFIDFEKYLRDPADRYKMKHSLAQSDNLHPNSTARKYLAGQYSNAIEDEIKKSKYYL